MNGSHCWQKRLTKELCFALQRPSTSVFVSCHIMLPYSIPVLGEESLLSTETYPVSVKNSSGFFFFCSSSLPLPPTPCVALWSVLDLQLLPVFKSISMPRVKATAEARKPLCFFLSKVLVHLALVASETVFCFQNIAFVFHLALLALDGREHTSLDKWEWKSLYIVRILEYLSVYSCMSCKLADFRILGT